MNDATAADERDDEGQAGSAKPLLRVLGGEALSRPPVWMMRQAGRYLPEYRALRAKAGSFLDLCYDPGFAAEVTLQPIRRFGFDAAILFSDILVVPHALGQPLWFAEGEGPRLEPVADADALARLRTPDDPAVAAHLDPVIATVTRVRETLDPDTTLIGFCGAPWTVASYMIAGRGSPDLAPARRMAAEAPALLDALIDRLVAASVAYLVRQLAAGADAVQIFESHAGTLPGRGDFGTADPRAGDDSLGRWSLGPIARIVAGVRERVPGAKLIVFARNAGLEAQARVAQATGADAVGIDYDTDLAAVRARLPGHVATQGNLDPQTLVAGGAALDRAVDGILAAADGHPHVFNLGHGIVPQTPIAHVERMLARVRGA